MFKRLSAFLIGLLFGIGLTISNMTNPYKILNFLDIFGHWDPTLLVVMTTALITTYIGYRLVFKLDKPVLESSFYIPQKTKISKRLIIGSFIFGIGWGATGYCPGPSISALATFNLDPVYFVIGLIAGSTVYWRLFEYSKNTNNNQSINT